MSIHPVWEGMTLEWLLEPSEPAVQYLVMRDLLAAPTSILEPVKQAAHRSGPISLILSHMDPNGFWIKEGAGYSPKYHSTVWSMISLAHLGADINQDERIKTACNYYLDHAIAADGQVTYNSLPSATIDCLQGNMCWALTELGCQDERLEKAFEWMARTVTGEGMAPQKDNSTSVRYYAYKCGPNFACGSNGQLPCAWGAVKVMLAFGRLPPEKRTPLIQRAIQKGIDFLLSVDPVEATYPVRPGGNISANWWKFSFPVFYISDILQIVDTLTAVGLTHDARLENAAAFIRSKQDAQGRWKLDYPYSGKIWASFGRRNQPNKWVTYRALRVLSRLE